MVCCHVPLNVCAEVVESSVGSSIGSENPASFTNPIPPHAARTSPLPSNLRIFQSEQLNPAAGPTQRHLAGNCCGGIAPEMAKELKALQKENTRLKKLVADQALDNAILKEAAKGNF